MLVYRRDDPRGRRLAMKRKRFSVEQIAAGLKQTELGVPMVDLVPQLVISAQKYYR